MLVIGSEGAYGKIAPFAYGKISGIRVPLPPHGTITEQG